MSDNDWIEELLEKDRNGEKLSGWEMSILSETGLIWEDVDEEEL
jgi:hypothetical protein